MSSGESGYFSTDYEALPLHSWLYGKVGSKEVNGKKTMMFAITVTLFSQMYYSAQCVYVCVLYSTNIILYDTN